MCFEDNEISPVKAYFGGKEGIGIYTWFRTTEKLDNLEPELVASCAKVVGETLCVLLPIAFTFERFILRANSFEIIECVTDCTNLHWLMLAFT